VSTSAIGADGRRCVRDWNDYRHVAALLRRVAKTKQGMIQTIRTLISKRVMRTAAGRLILSTGLIGLGLVTLDGAFHAYPGLAKAFEMAMPAILQQRVLVIAAFLLFAAAYVAGRREGQTRKGFLDQLLDFWEFHPLRERQLSYRLFEWAHLALIGVMFHRALFL
jgi:hypothetical protein